MVNKWLPPPEPHLSLRDQLLKSRPALKPEAAEELDSLPDERLLANIDTVSHRIRTAMYNNEPLCILGHDDPDGITSTYILYQFFNSCGYQRHTFYIPNRNLEPHGIQDSFVEFMRQNEPRLLIVVDNGITSLEGVRKLNELGVETIIVDHHLIQPEQLPEAYAILNPQLPHCQYPFKSLAGVGVVLMLIRYLGRLLDHPIPESAYFWTAIGSIADKVPMTGLNRLLVRHAMSNLDLANDPSVDFLLRNFNRVDGIMDTYNFMLYTARLIANGREPDGQHTAMRFLLQMGDEKAGLFQQLEQQKKAWESELNRVFSFLDTITAGFEGSSFIYFDDEDMIPYNLLGTASTYIVSNFGIPTIMLKIHNGNMVCEGRCGEGFNMVEAFSHCKGHLKQFGGHAKAAGFTMDSAEYDSFLECFNHFLSQQPIQPETEPGKHVDAAVGLAQLNNENWDTMEWMLPWGQMNPEPLIMVFDTNVGTLQQSFGLEFNGVNLPPDLRTDVIVHWKSKHTLRVVDYIRK
jgi:single-stranded-DNA-specific exonuclease